MTTRFIPINQLDKTRNYIIVGVQKSGTTSLAKYMRDKGYDVIEAEKHFLNVEFATNHDYSNYTPIIITRNPIERAWSDYNFFGGTLERACDNSFYKAGLQMWDALIYSLEYLKTITGFPWENRGNNTPIPDKIKDKIIQEIIP